VAEKTETRAKDVIARECQAQRLRSLNLGADGIASIDAVAQRTRADQPAGSFFLGYCLHIQIQSPFPNSQPGESFAAPLGEDT
jgi:hypothetical protein